MKKEPNISFSDLSDGRQVAKQMGMNSVELMRAIKKKTQKEGMGREELQRFCEKIFKE